MKFKSFFLLTAMLLSSLMLQAKNTTTTVKQVTESVTITDDVDYVITDATPFGATGSVNIENVEHAVVIIQKIRPSKVISSILKGHVFINGVQAVNGTNCQVRMFNRGAIIFPYSKTTKPLTCYTEQNFEGKAVSSYTEGSNGGFMKTLTDATLNNQIQSFKLKRGYMVTFAVGTGGWGYSRCFIADMEDLEFSVMPDPFKGTISSYRLFQWYNASKAGVHHTGWDANQALGTTSCFDWGQGNASLLPDVEWVAHHIYEDWPSAATCGGVSQTCHMKTNNEPGNSADDHPQSVEEVLGNWENLMRTGMRLCSESSHDGSMNHLKTFIEEIDKRGWRCDILDLHGYWDGQWNNLDWYISEYGKGRPVWFSEWVWGSSWGNNGAFAEGRRSDNATYNGTVPILQKLNAHPKVERYFYWNSEQWYTQIWRDNQLTKLGEYYATMDVPLAYNAANEYVPKIVCQDPGTLSGTYSKSKKTVALSWTDPNGDMLSSMVLQRQNPGSNTWNTVATIALKDKTDRNGASYAYTDTLEAEGLYNYRVMTTDPKKVKRYSDTFSVTVSAANSVGTLGYGTLQVGNTEVIETEFEPRLDSTGTAAYPAVFMGMVSNKNTANGLSNHITSISTRIFKFRLYPWALPTDKPGVVDKTETVDYLLLPFGTYQLNEESPLIVEKVGKVKGDTIQVAFPTAFPAGSKPVVVIQNNATNTTNPPVVARAWDITETGFKVVLTRQAGATGTFSTHDVNYMAALPGIYPIGQGKQLTVYQDETTAMGGTSNTELVFQSAKGDTLQFVNPIVIGAPQTFNYQGATSVFRQSSVYTMEFTEGEQTYTGTYSMRIRRQTDSTTKTTEKDNKAVNGDYMGFFILSDDIHATGTEQEIFVPTALRQVNAESFAVSTQGGMLSSSDASARAYNANGQEVSLGTRVPAGVYIITNGKQSIKVQVK